MKKATAANIILVGIVFIVGCVWGMDNLKFHSSLLGSDIYAVRDQNEDDITYDVNGLVVIKGNDSYSAFITDGATLIAEAVFDQSGSLTSCANVSPIRAAEFSEHAIRTRREMQQYLGAPHVDIGSGQYLPTYISDDGKLVTFQYADENVVGCIEKSIVDM